MNSEEAYKALQKLMARAKGKIGFRLEGMTFTAHCMICDGEFTTELEISHEGDQRLYEGLLKFQDEHQHVQPSK